MNKEQKAATVDEIAGQIKDSQAVFAIDYRGISVPQAAELREKLREADAVFRIVKNSLTERAADKAQAPILRELLDGPTALTFVAGDAALAAKALNDFSRANEILEFKGGFMDGAEVSPDEIKAIARLPAKDVLNAQLVAMVATPLTGLVRGLNGLISGLAIQLAQIAEQGLVTGKDPEPEAPAEEAAAPAEDAPAEEAEVPAEDAPAEEAAAPAEEAEAPAEEAPAAEAEPAPEPEGQADADAQAPAETDDNAQADASADAEPEPAAEAKEDQ